MAFLKGFDSVVKNLNREIKAIEGRTLKGLGLAVMMVRAEMDHTPPLIPIGETENLRASWFAEPLNMPAGPAVICGFSANYAAYVHELLGTKSGGPINWTRPGSGPKFFQAPLRRNKEKILETIRSNAQIR